MDKKCAPGVEYTHGSCINHETLENIADNFNNYFPEDKIESNLNKKELVKKLRDSRSVSLQKYGEYGVENMVFKELRNQGYIDKVRTVVVNLKSRSLSL